MTQLARADALEQWNAGAMTIRPASTLEDWAAAELLVREYVTSLEIPLDFQNIEGEIRHLQRTYGPPDGTFLLACAQDGIAGGGALRRFADDACEMKRLYVRPAAQGRGFGRALAAALIQQARRRGYRRMLLDTLPSMHEAHALYRSLGFRETAPYRFNPVRGTTFMELNL